MSRAATLRWQRENRGRHNANSLRSYHRRRDRELARLRFRRLIDRLVRLLFVVANERPIYTAYPPARGQREGAR